MSIQRETIISLRCSDNRAAAEAARPLKNLEFPPRRGGGRPARCLPYEKLSL
jgi:hypothetical protein